MKLDVKEKEISYIKVEYIYIPLEDNLKEYKSLVNENEYVYKGEIVAISKKDNFPKYSSVSGYVINIDYKYISSGKKVKCIAIKNDYKERYERKRYLKKINNLDKENFILNLKKYGIIDYDGIPSYIKYQKDSNYLVINALESDSFLCSYKNIINDNIEFILETIDNIISIMNLNKTYIIINKNDNLPIDNINTYLGTYLNIKIKKVDGKYSVLDDKFLIHKVFDTIDNNIIVNGLSSILAIGEMLKYNKPMLEKTIMFYGNGIEKNINVKVKIGTLVSDVIKNTNKYKKNKNLYCFINGPLKGKSSFNDDMVITSDINSIYIDSKNYEEKEECINCGKCDKVCPSKILPSLLVLNNKRNLNTNDCIECGLCSYVCPSKINVMNKIVENKK